MARAGEVRESSDIAAFRSIVRGKRCGPHSYASLLGLRVFETLKLLERVQAGFSYRAFERLQRNLDLSVDELASLVQIKPRTLARRREQGRLSAAESDRLLRASRVFGKTLDLFEGDADAARAWFSARAPALADRTPREISSTEVGAREVEDLIGRLEHGIFS